MAWQNCPLKEVYPVVYLDAIHYSVREDGIIRKLAAYVILGITLEGKKEVLSIQIGENETSKYWFSVLNGLKNRGVKDNPNPLLRWPFWYQGSYHSRIPENRAAEVYRTHGTQYPEIRCG